MGMIGNVMNNQSHGELHPCPRFGSSESCPSKQNILLYHKILDYTVW